MSKELEQELTEALTRIDESLERLKEVAKEIDDLKRRTDEFIASLNLPEENKND